MKLTIPKPEKRVKEPPKRLTRGKRPARVRKTTPGKLRAKADKLFSLIVRSVAVCQNCGRGDRPLQCAHGFSRRYLATRWVRENAWCLCSTCHVFYTWRPLEWTDWMLTMLGPERYEALRQKALYGVKPDYAAVVAELEAIS